MLEPIKRDEIKRRNSLVNVDELGIGKSRR